VPDTVLSKNVALGEMSTTAVDPRGLTTPFPGDMTPGFNTPASKLFPLTSLLGSLTVSVKVK